MPLSRTTRFSIGAIFAAFACSERRTRFSA